MDTANSIRTLKLRFTPYMAQRFSDFARSKGHSPSWNNEEEWHVMTMYFQNKSERSNFLRAWAAKSMIVSE